MAMEQISGQSISNCWRKTGILPTTMSAAIANCDERERHRDNATAVQLSELIGNLRLGDDALTAEEFEQFPREQQVQFCYNNYACCIAALLLGIADCKLML